MDALLGRHLTHRLGDGLRSFRIVALSGARQTGKTTLVNDLLNLPNVDPISFDNAATLRRATSDPMGFVEALQRPAVVDEFQRAGQDFLLAVKHAVDRDRTRGQLLLTGSANYLSARSITETLAGRVGRFELWPLSAGEKRGVRETFLDSLFAPEAWPPSVPAPSRAEVVEWILEGGYPEIVTEMLQGRSRRDWFDSYIRDVVSREALRPIADVRMEVQLRRVLRLLAARTGNELVISDLATDAQVSRETTANYVALLEALYLVTLLPAWATSANSRVKRRPKIVLHDTGLAADLCGVGEAEFSPTSSGRMAGAFFETMVMTELYKQAGWSERAVDLAHFRDRNGAEVDVIVEDRRTGQIAGIEVKLTSTPSDRHAKHLARIRDELGERFVTGVLIHAGRTTLPLGPKLWAVPISALWRSDN